MICCPACRKSNGLPREKAVCGRCGLDFSGLLEIRQAASRLQGAAAKHLQSGNFEEAHDCAAESWELRRAIPVARIAYVACLAQGEFEAAAAWHGYTR